MLTETLSGNGQVGWLQVVCSDLSAVWEAVLSVDLVSRPLPCRPVAVSQTADEYLRSAVRGGISKVLG